MNKEKSPFASLYKEVGEEIGTKAALTAFDNFFVRFYKGANVSVVANGHGSVFVIMREGRHFCAAPCRNHVYDVEQAIDMLRNYRNMVMVCDTTKMVVSESAMKVAETLWG